MHRCTGEHVHSVLAGRAVVLNVAHSREPAETGVLRSAQANNLGDVPPHRFLENGVEVAGCPVAKNDETLAWCKSFGKFWR